MFTANKNISPQTNKYSDLESLSKYPSYVLLSLTYISTFNLLHMGFDNFGVG